MLSHELRNPLSALIHATAVLGDAADDLERVRRAHGVLERQTRHMAHLLDDLLDIARIRGGKLRLRVTDCDLREAIEAGIGDQADEIEARGIVVLTEVPDARLSLRGDPVRLQQVVSSLLSNAVRHSEPGGRVELRARREGDRVRLAVVDHGEGIEPGLRARIFEPFVQSEQLLDRAQGGLGVGLTLVREIVELHGGQVEAHSEGRGKGSELAVILPLADAVKTGEDGRDAASSTRRARKVVLIEDQPDAREMLSMLLDARGHEVLEAEDGPQGIEIIAQTRPDVALIDIGLPSIDGYEVARRLRADPSLDDVTLVALTGYGTPADVEAAHAAGFDAHLTKPADSRRLEAILARSRLDDGARPPSDG